MSYNKIVKDAIKWRIKMIEDRIQYLLKNQDDDAYYQIELDIALETLKELKRELTEGAE